MIHPLDDTIVAIASAPGGGVRGIVRMSGPQSEEALARVFVPRKPRAEDDKVLSRPTVMQGRLTLGNPWPPVECDTYFWPRGRSYTGQASVEFHTIGSPPLLESIVATLCRLGARPAEPGEFTMRAFLAGRIDLTQAEAVLGVIDAPDQSTLDLALTQLAGGLADPLAELREELFDMLAHLEAGFDFADEDIEFISHEDLLTHLAHAKRLLGDVVAQLQTRRDATPVVRAILIGRPNVGKSSLFNMLIEDSRRHAIVSRIAGTTRDYLTARLDFNGTTCELIDTAGVENDELDTPSQEDLSDAVDFARLRAQSATAEQYRLAEIEILCLQSGSPLDEWESHQLVSSPRGVQRIVALTQCDIAKKGSGYFFNADKSSLTPFLAPFLTSAATGAGRDELLDELRRAALTASQHHGDGLLGTAVRCEDSLRRADEAINAAHELADRSDDETLIAGELRSALDALGVVVGETPTEDILGRIFSRFCVGK